MVHRNTTDFTQGAGFVKKILLQRNNTLGATRSGSDLAGFPAKKTRYLRYRVQTNPCGSEEEDFMVSKPLAPV
jgi:hypothetical protein